MAYTVIISAKAGKDIAYFAAHNRNLLDKIDRLIDAIEEGPFAGIGKPEPLKFELSGFWSRRIDHKNRLVYQVEKKQIAIISCRHHY